MENNLELIMANNRISERLCDSRIRSAVLKNLKGFRYWLFLFGL